MSMADCCFSVLLVRRRCDFSEIIFKVYQTVVPSLLMIQDLLWKFYFKKYAVAVKRSKDAQSIIDVAQRFIQIPGILFR